MFSFRNTFLLITIAVVIAGVAFILFRQSSTPIVAPVDRPAESPDIFTIQSAPEPEVSEVRSPDGKMKLTMENLAGGDSATYSFSVSETDQVTRKEIYTKTVPSGTNFEMSPNAWSPDNKYFFITEKGNNSVNYFVFREDGEPFSEDEKYISVVPLFVAHDTGYSFSEITGWDSETLLHVYTTKVGEAKGPSYWFEVPSKAIIQLASR